ncbi:hypothetical protein OG349_11035 [Streptomyces sp. NBC_01317]|nr:hypothetical protein OG349_11035 [Streptomyces sp. NBC_01317]
MGGVGPYLQLRPLGGGREWDADPTRVRPLTPTELLSARVSEANTRSRTALGLHDSPPTDLWVSGDGHIRCTAHPRPEEPKTR